MHPGQTTQTAMGLPVETTSLRETSFEGDFAWGAGEEPVMLTLEREGGARGGMTAVPKLFFKLAGSRPFADRKFSEAACRREDAKSFLVLWSSSSDS